MRANFRWSGPGCETLAVDPTSGAFVLQRRYVGPDLLEGGLAGAVRELLAQAERWTGTLAAIADRAAPEEPGEDRRGMPPGGGLRA